MLPIRSLVFCSSSRGAHSVGLAFIVGAAVLTACKTAASSPAGCGSSCPCAYLRGLVCLVPASFGPDEEQVHIEDFREIPSSVISSGAAGLSAMSGLFGTSGIEGVQLFNLTAGYLSARTRHRRGRLVGAKRNRLSPTTGFSSPLRSPIGSCSARSRTHFAPRRQVATSTRVLSFFSHRT